jgi:hypothetical protein
MIKYYIPYVKWSGVNIENTEPGWDERLLDGHGIQENVLSVTIKICGISSAYSQILNNARVSSVTNEPPICH